MAKSKESLLSVREQAQLELDAESFRASVDKEKAFLRKAKWWHKFIPRIKISIGKW